jgi:membrane protease YdiL (CAAX protease family)
MLVSLLSNLARAVQSKRLRWVVIVVLPLWILASFFAAQLLVLGGMYALSWAGVPLSDISQTLLLTVATAIVYAFMLAIVVGVPWLLFKSATTKQDVGLTRPMSWGDLGFAPLGFIVYFIISAILAYGVGQLLPGIDLKQLQETGFDHVTQYYQYIFALVSLVVIAPFAEELIFRGYLYGKLRKFMPVWVAMLLTSVLFGLIHGQWNVAIDVFALSMVLCGLREITGSIWAGVLLHMIKNGIAYYVLFIYPLLSHTMGG